MVQAENPAVADMARAALDWWRDAGVDSDFRDEPQDWLAKVAEDVSPERPQPVAQPKRVKAEPPTVEAALDSTSFPADLDAFRRWWLTEPSLDGGRTEGRIAPHGPKGAELMLILPDPHDFAQDSLLSGADSRFIRQMLHAMGLAENAVYFASVLPRHTPLPDWQQLGRQGFGALLAHHIALVVPKRIIVLGGNILPLLGHDPANSPAFLTRFNRESLNVPLLATRDLPLLQARPSWKKALWSAWLDMDNG